MTNWLDLVGEDRSNFRVVPLILYHTVLGAIGLP